MKIVVGMRTDMWTATLQSARRAVLTTVAAASIALFGAGCSPAAEPAPRGSIASKLGVTELSLNSMQQLEQRALVVYEEEVALCMKGQGFDYRSRPLEEPVLQNRAGTNTEAEFVERFGWGIVYSMTAEDERVDASAAIGENERIYKGLSSTARDAYDAALEGTFDTDGCESTATQATRTAVPGYALVDEYGDQIEQTIERFSTDLRIVAFHRKWSSCMSEFQHDYPSPDALSREIARRARTVPASTRTTPTEWLAEVRDFELDVAAASLECGVGPTVYGQPAVYETVLDGLEQRFLSENPDFLAG